jgi:hypothetical protein
MVAHELKEFVRKNLEWSFDPLDRISENGREEFLKFAWGLADLITRGNEETARTNLKRFTKALTEAPYNYAFPDTVILNILLLLGAANAPKLVEFVRPGENWFIYKFKDGKNAFHIAIECKNEKAVEQLFHEWLQIKVSNPLEEESIRIRAYRKISPCTMSGGQTFQLPLIARVTLPEYSLAFHPILVKQNML